jgi:hypothetical protein
VIPIAATMSVKEVNGGATPVASTITNARFCTDDDYNPGTDNPLVKPDPAGTNYSFKKTLYLNADTSPTGTINNIKFYCDGEIGWTGVDVEGKAVDAYTEPTGTPGTTGDDNEGTDIETYTSASPLSLTGSIDNPSTGKVSQYLELQAVVSDSAVAGALAAETCTFRYDET